MNEMGMIDVQYTRSLSTQGRRKEHMKSGSPEARSLMKHVHICPKGELLKIKL